jgi:hypothetical protein
VMKLYPILETAGFTKKTLNILSSEIPGPVRGTARS